MADAEEGAEAAVSKATFDQGLMRWREERKVTKRDRIGMGWRPELAAGIVENLDKIDVIEVIADDFFGARKSKLEGLRFLAEQAQVVLHGVGMGLASAALVEERRLAQMAKLVERVRPEGWSEHLAFVRGGGVEIGHLAAPPRTAATVEGAARNIRRAREVVGTAPEVENIATLVEPPGDWPEWEWVHRTIAASGAGLLLDLHNLYANAMNHGYDAVAALRAIPAECFETIHIAGGKLIPATDGRDRLLDDHLHDVPDPVYALLEAATSRAMRPLTVILERDGRYPAMGELLEQIAAARAAVRRGRARAEMLGESTSRMGEVAA